MSLPKSGRPSDLVLSELERLREGDVAFPSLRRIQSDVVGMVAGLVHGGESAAGFMTTGGTESLLLAVLAARERGRKERGIAAPEMVLPASAYGTVE